MSRIVEDYKKKTEEALSKIETLEQIRAKSKEIDFVYKVGEKLFATDLDALDEGWLIRHGGRLTGIVAWLGNKSAQARAERDVYEQKLEEVESRLLASLLSGGEYKVTEARARVKIEISELAEYVTLKNMEKTNLENLLNATDKMVSFIQTALAQKRSEHYKSKEAYDNA